MAGFGFFGALLLYVFGLFILYLIIQAAVRNAIDNSNTGKMIRKYLKEKTRIDVTKDD